MYAQHMIICRNLKNYPNHSYLSRAMRSDGTQGLKHLYVQTEMVHFFYNIFSVNAANKCSHHSYITVILTVLPTRSRNPILMPLLFLPPLFESRPLQQVKPLLRSVMEELHTHNWIPSLLSLRKVLVDRQLTFLHHWLSKAVYPFT